MVGENGVIRSNNMELKLKDRKQFTIKTVKEVLEQEGII